MIPSSRFRRRGDLEHGGTARGIEARRRLVHHEDPRPHRDRAGDRQALLLAARQGHRVPGLEPGQAHGAERVLDPSGHRRPRHAQVLEAERDLVGHRRLAELGLGIVEHHRDVAGHVADRRRRRIPPGHRDPPRPLAGQEVGHDAVERQEQGRLAGPVEPDDPDELARRDLQRDVAERGRGVRGVRVGERQPLDRDGDVTGHPAGARQAAGGGASATR